MIQAMNPLFTPIYNTVISAIAGGVVAWLVAKIKSMKQQKVDEETELKNDMAVMKQGMQIMLRGQLYKWHDYLRDKPHITVNEFREVDEIHTVYKSLGGNHTGDELYAELKQKGKVMKR